MDWAILNGERFAGILSYIHLKKCVYYFEGVTNSCVHHGILYALGLYATVSLLVFNASHLLTMHAASIKTWFEKVN